jgi:hypothetical protein
MKKILYIMMIIPFVACASFINGTVPEKKTSTSSAVIVVRLSTAMSIARIYFRKDAMLYKTEKFGEYYVLFNAVPGTYSLERGESVDDRHEFGDAMKKQCTVTVSEGDFIFIGSYKVKVEKQNEIYKDVPLMLNSDFNRVLERTDYYYGDPVKMDTETAAKEFINAMRDRLAAKGWDVTQMKTL